MEKEDGAGAQRSEEEGRTLDEPQNTDIFDVAWVMGEWVRELRNEVDLGKS